MVNTPSQAIAKANSITTGYGGLCLAFVQDCYGAAAVEPSAIAAWNNSAHKHPTTSLDGIPVGAPIYFSGGGPYGHVAIYLGNGMMRTTNSADNLIHTDPVSTWQSWGYTLLGWTEDIENQMIPGLTSGTSGAAADTGSPIVIGGRYKCVVDALNVRDTPSTAGKIVATYTRGQTVNLEAWGEYHDGYLWGRYVGGSGNTRYIAIGTQSGDWYLAID